MGIQRRLSDLMAPLTLLLFLLSEAASDLTVVTVDPGDNVILPCRAAGSSIRAVVWTRPDLEPPEYVLYYRDGHLDPTHQHPSFKDRVELVDRDLKDGDMSLTLKNVNINDQGTYECRVKTSDSKTSIIDSDPIRIIRLQVPESADLTLIKLRPGDDVILPCKAADSAIIAVEWSRADLKQVNILFYSDGHLDPTYQNPSFKDRVDLVYRYLKDGDMSLILKNVNSNDNGTYECRVATAGSRRKKRAFIDSEPIRTFRLQITEPADLNSGHPMDENSMNDVPEDGNSSHIGQYRGLAAGIAVGLILVAVVAVFGVLIYKRRKDKRSGPPAAADDDDDDDDEADKFI